MKVFGSASDLLVALTPRAEIRDVRQSLSVLRSSGWSIVELAGMSALGQKRTSALHKAMSALPPIATSNAT